MLDQQASQDPPAPQDPPAQQIPQDQRPRYNVTFEKLVLCFDETTEDGKNNKLIGLLAYGLYKEDKRRFYRRFWDKYKRSLNSEDKDHIMLSFDDVRLDKYRQEAENMLYEFAEGYLEGEAPNIYEASRQDVLVNKVSAILDKKVSWLASFGASFFSTLLWTIVIAAFLGICAAFYKDSAASKLATAFFTNERVIVKYESEGPKQESPAPGS